VKSEAAELLGTLPEIARLNGHREWIDLDFVERQRTPASAMALGT
jgi:putative transposase